MELTQLEYFRTVARLEHFTKAAEELHISQPALSRTISRLEENVGAQLFERSGNRVKLNSLGEKFLRRVERALRELDDGVLEISDLKSEESGKIAISTSTSGFLSRPLVAFLTEHPNVHLVHFIQEPAQMIASLRAGETDFAVSFSPVNREDVLWTPLLTEEILAFVGENHQLAQRGTVSLTELSGERFIFNSSSFGMRDAICDRCRLLGFEPDIFYEGGEDEMIVPLVEKNLGVLFVTSMAHYWRRTESPIQPEHPLAMLRLSDTIGQRTIGILTLRGHYLPSASRHLLEYLRDYFKTGTDPSGAGA
jgi:DNA-binding transcriptional LysR family regulator